MATEQDVYDALASGGVTNPDRYRVEGTRADNVFRVWDDGGSRYAGNLDALGSTIAAQLQSDTTLGDGDPPPTPSERLADTEVFFGESDPTGEELVDFATTDAGDRIHVTTHRAADSGEERHSVSFYGPEGAGDGEMLFSFEIDEDRTNPVSKLRADLSKVAESGNAAPDMLSTDAALAEAYSNRMERRDLRTQLDQTLTDSGYDPDEWNTDARADGTLIIQDPESNRTETIEPGESADTFNPDTFDPSTGGTESPSSAPESNGTGATLPDMSGLNRPKVVAAIFGIIALIYGATQ